MNKETRDDLLLLYARCQAVEFVFITNLAYNENLCVKLYSLNFFMRKKYEKQVMIYICIFTFLSIRVIWLIEVMTSREKAHVIEIITGFSHYGSKLQKPFIKSLNFVLDLFRYFKKLATFFPSNQGYATCALLKK